MLIIYCTFKIIYAVSQNECKYEAKFQYMFFNVNTIKCHKIILNVCYLCTVNYALNLLYFFHICI